MSKDSNLVDEILENILVKLAALELREDFTPINQDTYSAQHLMPNFATRPNTRMSQEDLDNLFKSIIQSSSVHHRFKWAKYFFGPVLSKRVFLSSFIQYITEESRFYSNYKYVSLIEDNVQVRANLRDSSVLYIQKHADQNVEAYIRTVANPSLYISSIPSNTYNHFLQISPTSSQSDEGRKLLRYSQTVQKTILSNVLDRLKSEYSNNKEVQTVLAPLLTEAVPPILLDTISLAFVDILNLNTQRDYGSQKQAGSALLSSEILRDGVAEFNNSKIFGFTPNLAKYIYSQLEAILKLENPYIKNLDELFHAKQTLRTKNSFYKRYGSSTFSTWSNLVSFLGHTFGGTIDLDDLIVNSNGTLKSLEEKKQALISYPKIGPTGKHASANSKIIPNAFIKIKGTMDEEINSYCIDATSMIGLTYKIKATGQDLVSISSPLSKKIVIPKDVMIKAISLAAERQRTDVDGIFDAFGSLDESSISQVNYGMGEKKVPKIQLLNILKALYNEQTQFFNNDPIFSAVPYLLITAARYGIDILTTDKIIPDLEDVDKFKFTNEPNKVKEVDERNIKMTINRIDGTALSQEAVIKNCGFKSLVAFYNEYMDELSDLNFSHSKLYSLNERFKNLVENLERGLWTTKGLMATKNPHYKLAFFNPLSNSGGTIYITPDTYSRIEEFHTSILLSVKKKEI